MRLASVLREAFVSQTQIDLRDDEIPGSQDEAERARDLAASGIENIRAWKLGATIPAVRKDLGLARAFFGPLSADLVFDDGADLSGFHTRLQGVESEYGFDLARDVEPGDAEGDDESLRRLFACVRPTLEIPGTRYAALGRYGGFGLVADFGAAGGLALGPAREIGDWARLDKAPVRLSFAGRPIATGAAGVIEGGATGLLRAFLRQALQAGYTLRKGQTIVTGSCTGYVKAPADELIEARFEALDASVSLTFRQ